MSPCADVALPMTMLPEKPNADAIRAAFLADEVECLAHLIPLASLDADASTRVSARARRWVEAVRARYASHTGMESFLHQYDLSTQEGVLLMCVAEALLRIPDAATADRLIRARLLWRERLIVVDRPDAAAARSDRRRHEAVDESRRERIDPRGDHVEVRDRGDQEKRGNR